MLIEILEDYNYIVNDEKYIKGQQIEVSDLYTFKDNYIRYYDYYIKNYGEVSTIDYIPKNICRIISDK